MGQEIVCRCACIEPDPVRHDRKPLNPESNMLSTHASLRWASRARLACLALFVAASVPSALQGQSADGLMPLDVFSLQTAQDPQISPDGSTIVYVRHFADVMSDRRYSNLWLVDFAGTNHRPLTTGQFSDSSPRWSPDGTRLLYISDRNGTAQLFVRWMESGETAQVTHLTEPPSSPAWSPDGEWIAFAALVPHDPPSLGEIPAAPAGAEWAEPARILDKLVYRFDGVGWLKPGYSHVFVVPAVGGAARQITSGSFHHGGGRGRGSGEPVWTADGRHVLISAVRRPDYEMESRDTEIYEFDVSTRAVRALTDRRGPDDSPTVSPDGRHIAYLGMDDRFQGYQITRLYVMDRDGGNPRVISGELDRDVRRPRWAPDGSGIYFLYDDEGNTKLAHYTLDGRMTTLLGNVGSGESAYGGGGAFSISRNGRVAYTHTTPHVPGDVATATLADPAPRVVTAVNAGLLSGRQLGEVEEIWYPSRLDETPIHGWIIKPPDFDPARRYPLILEIHGGPFANYGDRFSLEKQMWASQGYVVLYTNPRGSTSYGEEFGNAIHHAYPGDDFYDLDSGVDAMLATGYIDPDQLFVTGGSGGGVLTAWMIGRTDRFRAAVSVYPVINWYSFNLTSDISPMTNRYWFPGFPWDHPEHYESRNLTSVVSNVTTPTMILTGEEDYRTPMSESEQYYQALKLLGVETMLIRVPEEPHGIRVRPSHHMAKIQYISGWFDRYREEAVSEDGG
jgi:dipeptidyl aminopeptidase/acylaminoacyl peptidase